MTWYIEEQDKSFFDYNATTPIDEQVEKAIIDAIKIWGNPSSDNEFGEKARNTIENARNNVAKLLNVTAKDVFFTSGGTETNVWVIHSCMEHRKAVQGRDYKPHIIASSIEHPSILTLLTDLQTKHEIDLTTIDVDPETGVIKLEDLQEALCERTCLVTVMIANNETGVIQPVAAVADIARSAGDRFEGRVFVHSDASQAIGKLEISLETLNVDMVTITGHKFYGPRVGALVVRAERSVPLIPLFIGGGQERGKRAGTENTPMIVGLGQAAQISCEQTGKFMQQMLVVRTHFEKCLKEALNDQVTINFEHSERLPNTSSVTFLRYPGTAIELLSKCKTFTASTGAACHSGSTKCSRVLLACGLREELASRTLRFSFGRWSTCEQVDRAIAELKALMFMGRHGSSLLSAINKGPVSGF